MAKRLTRAVHATPGTLLYYSLNRLKRPARHEDWDAWGICEYKYHFWVGRRVSIEGKDTLRLPLLDVLERKDEEYPDWGDEEVYLLYGIDDRSKAFQWLLLNKEEFDEGGRTVRRADST